MRIQFTSPVIYETEGPHRGVEYSAGQVVDLRKDLAERWLRRGVAVLVETPAREPDAQLELGSALAMTQAAEPPGQPDPADSALTQQPVEQPPAAVAPLAETLATPVAAKAPSKSRKSGSR